MKKTILATTILSMISFGTLAQQVNVVKANQETKTLIDNQMSAIDASVLAQLEAQDSSALVVDGDLYQKDSEGGWAMVGATSAALLAGLVSGSSSNTSRVKDPSLPGNLPNIDAAHPVENTPVTPIEQTPDADNGRQISKVGDNIWMITTHDEMDGYIVDERAHNDGLKIYDKNGTLVRHLDGSKLPVDGGFDNIDPDYGVEVGSWKRVDTGGAEGMLKFEKVTEDGVQERIIVDERAHNEGIKIYDENGALVRHLDGSKLPVDGGFDNIDPDYGVEVGSWKRVDTGGEEGMLKFEKVTEDGVQERIIVDERAHNEGIKIYDENGTLVRHLDGSKLPVDGGFDNIDPDYGVEVGSWKRVDTGGAEGMLKFEKVTEDGVQERIIVDERAHNEGIKIYDENGTLVRHLDGSKLPVDGGFDNIDPDYGVEVGSWKRVDTGGAEGMLKFEKVTEDGVQERIIVDERAHNEGIKIYDENGTLVRHLDGSKLPVDGGFDNIDPDYGVEVGSWKRVDTGGAEGMLKFEKVTEDGVQERIIVDERAHNEGIKIYDENGTLVRHLDGSKLPVDGGFDNIDPDYGVEVGSWKRVDTGGAEGMLKFEKVTEDGVQERIIVDERAHNEGIKIYDENGTLVRHLDGSKLPVDGGFDNIDPDYGVEVGSWKRVDTGGAEGMLKFEKVTEDGVQERIIVDERDHNDGVKVYDEDGTLINHITGDISADGGYIETSLGGEIHITVDRESGRIDGVYLNDVAQQRVDNIKDHIGSNPNFKKNLKQLKKRVMSSRG